MNNMFDTLIPQVGVITDVRIDTPDIKTFRVVTPDGKKAFDHRPGQCAMLSIPGVGEAMFSITSSPTNREFMEFSIKKCGCVTDWLHQAEVGQQITIRGPYGNPFPVDDVFAGKDLLFIAVDLHINRIDDFYIRLLSGIDAAPYQFDLPHLGVVDLQHLRRFKLQLDDVMLRRHRDLS